MSYEHIYQTLEAQGWDATFCQDDSSWELKRFTPAGEDWIIYLPVAGDSARDLAEAIFEYYLGFNVDEEAAELIANRGKFGVPDSVRTILEDVEWKDEELETLTLNFEEEGRNV